MLTTLFKTKKKPHTYRKNYTNTMFLFTIINGELVILPALPGIILLDPLKMI